MHNIYNFYEELDPKIYNNLEHRNLYVLDLDCDHAIDVLQQVTYTARPAISILRMKIQANKNIVYKSRNKTIKKRIKNAFFIYFADTLTDETDKQFHRRYVLYQSSNLS